jgi:hypothetical protein
MPGERIFGEGQVALVTWNPGCLARRRLRRCFLRRSPHRPPPSCAPFAPGPLRPFPATMDAVTPARPAVRIPFHSEGKIDNGIEMLL